MEIKPNVLRLEILVMWKWAILTPGLHVKNMGYKGHTALVKKDGTQLLPQKRIYYRHDSISFLVSQKLV